LDLKRGLEIMPDLRELLEQIPFLRETHWAFACGVVLLLIASELVLLALARLEDKQFGAVHLGVMFTPLCTGFPNLVLGLFGQDRLSGDLVLQLNLGNNIANTTLVTGVILALAGPLESRPDKGRSKRARAARGSYFGLLVFFWVAAIATLYTAADGRIDARDGLLLAGLYAGFQLWMLRRRGKPPKKRRLNVGLAVASMLLLLCAAIVIAVAVEAIGMGMDRLGSRLPGNSLGLMLGLLMVIPESFLLLRLAFRSGSLSLSGLIGDCLVSVPLVIGLSAMVREIPTASLGLTWSSGWLPWAQLAAAMTAFTLVGVRRRPIGRRVGLALIALYAIFWVSAGGAP
jgi:hypothetical protein